MTKYRENFREYLIETNPDFKKLVEDHQYLDSQADDLSSQKYLTDKERILLHKIKRKKLLVRDKIERRIKQAEARTPGI